MASDPMYTVKDVAFQAQQFTLWAKAHNRHFNAESMKEIRAIYKRK